MKRGLVQFATNIPHRDQLFKQFENWAPHKSERRKDDGPDCAAQIWRRYNGEIFPNMVTTLQPSGFTFEPEIPEEVDPHADERENADIELLARMTMPHAG
jgi:hypothetical protein